MPPIDDVHITYKKVLAIHDYKDYKAHLNQLIQQLADRGFVTERDTREKVVDPLFMGLGDDYDVKSDGSNELHSYDVKSDGSKELHLDYVKPDYVKRAYVKRDGSEAPHVYKLYYLYCEGNKGGKREEVFSTNPYFGIADFQKLYGFSFSAIVDLIIKNGSKLVMVESKNEGQLDHLTAPQYKSDGAIKLLNRCKKVEIDEISKFCDKYGKSRTNPNNNPYTIGDMPDINLPDISTIDVHWYDPDDPDDDPNTDPAYDAGTEFTLTFKDGTKVKLYQSDWYLFDLLYAKADVRSAVLIDGKVARRFYKKDGQITSKDYDLTDTSQFDEFRADVKSDLA